ncbi:unnamed protein product [Prorocentrum cordatum]|uniref:Acetylornithine transaminase n=1 Tax=Prorocentrum cordatum TaxID=2364126 RepID=A0ABN9SKW0_9DINO|nr:unnamed protein product [Polarella glacialis]
MEGDGVLLLVPSAAILATHLEPRPSAPASFCMTAAGSLQGFTWPLLPGPPQPAAATHQAVLLLSGAAVGAALCLALGRGSRRRSHRLRGDELPSLRTKIPGPQSIALVDRLARHECPAITARRARRACALGSASADPIVWRAARGACVLDVDGNVFVDVTSGFGVAALGHARAAVCDALTRQAAVPLLHAMGDAFADETRIALLEELCAFVGHGMDKAILGCSGADAVQAALKTAALATGRSGVLAFSGGYHGLAHGALAPTAYKQDAQSAAAHHHNPQPGPSSSPGVQEAFRAPFAEQLGEHVRFAEFGALPLPPLDGVGAVLLEPIQGRGGIREPPPGWLSAVRAACDAAGALLVYDEIYSGFGRTGAWFAWQALDGPAPDLLCVGKAMAGGFPVSACLGTRAAMDAWGASRGESLHTQTFLGNPMGCAMARAALRELRALDAPALARQQGGALRDALAAAGFARSSVRGRGLMLALALVDPLHAMAALQQRGVIALPCGDGADFALAIVPPLTITGAQMRAVAAALRSGEDEREAAGRGEP